MIQNKVIIWGADNSHALGVVRQLANHGLDIMFLVDGKSHNCALKSKYCTKYKLTATKQDGLRYLLQNYKNERAKPILILMGDGVAEIVDKYRDELLPYFHLSGTEKSGLLSEIDNKNLMTALAQKHGFDVPSSSQFCWNSSTANILFPCILKPCYLVSGRLDFKYKICRTEKELKDAAKLMNPGNVYILQQYIEKDYDILIYGCRFNDGRVSLAGTYYKDRWSDDGAASHGFLVPQIPQCARKDSIISFLDEINYHGLFSVEYGLKGNKAYFYEFNLRNDGTSHIFYQCGANMPLAWVYDCAGVKFEDRLNVMGKKYAINEILDPINIKRKIVTKEQWAKDKENATAFYFYTKDDPEPWRIMNRTAWLNRWLRAMALKYRPVVTHLLDNI